MGLLAIYTPRLPTYAEWLKMSDEQRLQWRYDFSVAPARAISPFSSAVQGLNTNERSKRDSASIRLWLRNCDVHRWLHIPRVSPLRSAESRLTMAESKTPKSDQLRALREAKAAARKPVSKPAPERIAVAAAIVNNLASPNASPNTAYARNARWRQKHPEAYKSGQRDLMRARRAEFQK